MRNVWLIIRREYLERVRTRSFVVLTLLLPAIMALGFVLPVRLASMNTGKPEHLVLVVSSQQFGELVRGQLLSPKSSADDDDTGEQVTRDRRSAARYLIDLDVHPNSAENETLRSRLAAGTIDGYLWLTDAAVQAKKVVYTGRNMAGLTERSWLSDSIGRALVAQQLAARGVASDQVDQLLQPVQVETVRVSHGKAGKSDDRAMFFAVFAMVMLLYVAVIFYGVSVMRSVLEEKNTRIMEVLLSSTTSTQLMAGKLLGVGAVGLTQIGIWIVLAGMIALPSLAFYPSLSEIRISPAALASFVLLFLLGYLLYSAVYAAIGAVVTTEQEGQQLQFIIVLPLIIAVFLMGPVMRAPDAPLAVWTSMIPFFSPVLLYLRIAVQPPPAWQIVLSLALLAGTIAGMLLVCARIYRVGVLMYGKRPTLPEIMKWLKYAKA
ncbi:MAG TPA: ABC transporter permease [Terriglobales bacterium]|nr:ABC transporter permease [Terriglobales bacterium]